MCSAKWPETGKQVINLRDSESRRLGKVRPTNGLFLLLIRSSRCALHFGAGASRREGNAPISIFHCLPVYTHTQTHTHIYTVESFLQIWHPSCAERNEKEASQGKGRDAAHLPARAYRERDFVILGIPRYIYI